MTAWHVLIDTKPNIMDPKMEELLAVFTRNILRKIHQEFDIPYEQLLRVIKPSTTEACGAIIKKKDGTTMPCKVASSRCKKHLKSQKQAACNTDADALQYVVIHDKPQLINPITHDIYDVCNTRTSIGKLGEGVFACAPIF